MSIFGNGDERRARKVEEAERRRRLEELTLTAKRGIAAWAETGAALESIRSEELWRLAAPTWDSWCQEVLHLSARRVEQLIAAAGTFKKFAAAGIEPPATERAARELAGLPTEAAIEAWQEATEVAGGQEPTAELVAKAAAKRKPKKKNRRAVAKPATFKVPGANVRVTPRRNGFTSMVAALEHALEIARQRGQAEPPAEAA